MDHPGWIAGGGIAMLLAVNKDKIFKKIPIYEKKETSEDAGAAKAGDAGANEKEAAEANEHDHRQHAAQANEKMRLAAEGGDADEVRRLAESGEAGKASVDAKNYSGAPAVVAAAALGHTEVVRALCEAGCDPNARRPGNQTALMDAAWKGKSEVVGALLDCPEIDLDAVNASDMTALMHATRYDHEDIVARLIRKRAKFNIDHLTNDHFLTNSELVPGVRVGDIRIDEAERLKIKYTEMLTDLQAYADARLHDAAKRGEAGEVSHLIEIYGASFTMI